MEELYGPEKESSQFDLFRGDQAGGGQEAAGKLQKGDTPKPTREKSDSKNGSSRLLTLGKWGKFISG